MKPRILLCFSLTIALVPFPTHAQLPGGTYTVGAGTGTFPTLKSAFDSINTVGISGNVTLSVLPAGTVEPAEAILNPVNYGGPTPFTITIKPAAGASPIITGAFPRFVIKFAGADNVVLDGSNSPGGTSRDLTISSTTTTTNSGAVWVGSLGTNAGAENITIKNCILIGGRNDTTNIMGVYAATADTITSNGTGAHNNNLVVENNDIRRVRFGVFSRGVAATGIQTGLVVRNNDIGSNNTDYELSYRGIDIASTEAPEISGNHIFNVIQPLTFTATGIHIDVNVSNAMIVKNAIYRIHQTNTGTYGALGININTSTGTSNITIANNMIADLRNDGGGTSTASNPFGIRIGGGTNHKVYYNSVSLSGSFFNASTSDLSAAFIITVSAATGLDVRNNIFSNSMTGGGTTKCYGIYAVSTATSFGTINNNDYFVSGANGILGRQGTTDVPTIAGWRTFTGQDAASVSGDPLFLNTATNLHIDSTSGGSAASNAATPIVTVPTDIDGQLRSAAAPDIGADEFGGPTAVASGDNQLPGMFQLAQNYPNPFNPSTMIRYALPLKAAVQLKIYNVLGQEIAVLTNNDVQPAGSHSVVWDGRSDFGDPVASGIYFYRLEARAEAGGQRFTSLKKMIYLK